jgi:hypothetical protein
MAAINRSLPIAVRYQCRETKPHDRDASRHRSPQPRAASHCAPSRSMKAEPSITVSVITRPGGGSILVSSSAVTSNHSRIRNGASTSPEHLSSYDCSVARREVACLHYNRNVNLRLRNTAAMRDWQKPHGQVLFGRGHCISRTNSGCRHPRRVESCEVTAPIAPQSRPSRRV